MHILTLAGLLLFPPLPLPPPLSPHCRETFCVPRLHLSLIPCLGRWGDCAGSGLPASSTTLLMLRGSGQEQGHGLSAHSLHLPTELLHSAVFFSSHPLVPALAPLELTFWDFAFRV